MFKGLFPNALKQSSKFKIRVTLYLPLAAKGTTLNLYLSLSWGQNQKNNSLSSSDHFGDSFQVFSCIIRECCALRHCAHERESRQPIHFLTRVLIGWLYRNVYIFYQPYLLEKFWQWYNSINNIVSKNGLISSGISYITNSQIQNEHQNKCKAKTKNACIV